MVMRLHVIKKEIISRPPSLLFTRMQPEVKQRGCLRPSEQYGYKFRLFGETLTNL